MRTPVCAARLICLAQARQRQSASQARSSLQAAQHPSPGSSAPSSAPSIAMRARALRARAGMCARPCGLSAGCLRVLCARPPRGARGAAPTRVIPRDEGVEPVGAPERVVQVVILRQGRRGALRGQLRRLQRIHRPAASRQEAEAAPQRRGLHGCFGHITQQCRRGMGSGGGACEAGSQTRIPNACRTPRVCGLAARD